MTLIEASKDDGPLDIKNELSAFEGYLFDGKYMTGRELGNYLFGMNARDIGLSKFETMMGAGTYANIREGKFPVGLPPYYGEAPYSGRNIEAGWDAGSRNHWLIPPIPACIWPFC